MSHVEDKALRERLAGLGETISEEPVAANDKMSKTMRTAPKRDAQPDFFVPSVYDIPVKDGIDLMDIAVFRLSKKQTRKGDIIRYKLPGSIIEVAGGAHGMATIYDYDIVLMAISHLANAIKVYRQERGKKPSKVLQLHSTDIFKFCRTGAGGKDYDRLSSALDRLQGTFIKIDSLSDDRKKRRTGYFPLIAGAKIVSHTNSDRIGTMEITIPDWIYDGVVSHENPEVLTVNADYFLLKKGLAKFLYRFARKTAGDTQSEYGFDKVYARSGTTREFKKFVFELRGIITANDLPDYELSEEAGKNGPKLVIRSRKYMARLKDESAGP